MFTHERPARFRVLPHTKELVFSLLYLITQCARKVCAVFYVHIIYKMTEYRLLKYTPGLGYNSI
jgi:hypothetical protein